MCDCSILDDTLENRVRMAEIFEKQYDLNAKTLTKIGVSYDEITSCANPDLTSLWLGRYADAMMNELAEMMSAADHRQATPAVILEAIDILHFLVSQTQVIGMSSDVVFQMSEHRTLFSLEELVSMFCVTRERLRDTDKRWKWWATDGQFDGRAAMVAVFVFWSLFEALCRMLGISNARMYEIYMKKNAANHKRQDDGYSVATKTEDDNHAIEATI